MPEIYQVARVWRFISNYAEARSKIWNEIHSFLGRLPPRILPIADKVRDRIVRRTSIDGESENAFTKPAAARILHLPLWVAAAYEKRGRAPKDADGVQTVLAISACLGFFSVRIQDDIIDGDVDNSHLNELPLSDLCLLESYRLLLKCLPAESGFWEIYHELWHDFAEAIEWEKIRNTTGLYEYTTSDLDLLAAKSEMDPRNWTAC
jgi:hypothetical protein